MRRKVVMEVILVEELIKSSPWKSLFLIEGTPQQGALDLQLIKRQFSKWSRILQHNRLLDLKVREATERHLSVVVIVKLRYLRSKNLSHSLMIENHPLVLLSLRSSLQSVEVAHLNSLPSSYLLYPLRKILIKKVDLVAIMTVRKCSIITLQR